MRIAKVSPEKLSFKKVFSVGFSVGNCSSGSWSGSSGSSSSWSSSSWSDSSPSWHSGSRTKSYSSPRYRHKYRGPSVPTRTNNFYYWDTAPNYYHYYDNYPYRNIWSCFNGNKAREITTAIPSKVVRKVQHKLNPARNSIVGGLIGSLGLGIYKKAFWVQKINMKNETMLKFNFESSLAKYPLIGLAVGVVGGLLVYNLRKAIQNNKSV